MQSKLKINNLQVKYKVLSTKRLPDLQKEIDRLNNENRLSNHKVYRHYIDRLYYKKPEDFPDAKYIVILAIEHNLAKVNFHISDTVQEILLPAAYHKIDATIDEMIDFIQKEIIGSDKHRVEHNRSMHLKLLAVRSGLGRYGKNNICYVDGLGSFLSIYTFFTDFDFKKDNWSDIKALDQCENCSICTNKCPTGAISKENFLIDIEKCLPLYNEIQGEFPDWIDPEAHNAIMGCLKCQMYCPANKEAMKKILQFEDITEEESKMILDGRFEEELVKSIGKKIKMYDDRTAEYYLPVIKRNLEVLIN